MILLWRFMMSHIVMGKRATCGRREITFQKPKINHTYKKQKGKVQSLINLKSVSYHELYFDFIIPRSGITITQSIPNWDNSCSFSFPFQAETIPCITTHSIFEGRNSLGGFAATNEVTELSFEQLLQEMSSKSCVN